MNRESRRLHMLNKYSQIIHGTQTLSLSCIIYKILLVWQRLKLDS